MIKAEIKVTGFDTSKKEVTEIISIVLKHDDIKQKNVKAKVKNLMANKGILYTSHQIISSKNVQ